MNKTIKFITLCLVLALFATGCGTRGTTGNTGGNNGITNTPGGDGGSSGDKTTMVDFEAEVIEADTFLLVAPDKESSEARSSDRISVSFTESALKDKNGSAITLQELKPGDILKITYNGMIAESYPAQIQASGISVIGHNNLIDGYLAIIDDIWQEDSGLNGDIEMITVDTTGWIGLSDIEKEIILAKMKETYGFKIIVGTFDELAEQGIIDKKNLYFENGVHIAISDMKYDGKAEKITYSISKWRGGDGAVGSDGTTAELKDGSWVITKGARWIS